MTDTQKQQIISELKVLPKIDPATEIEKRKDFIKTALRNSGLNYLILGISGGIDSTTLGKLAQLAVNELNVIENKYQFVAVRLPYNIQADESDAQLALEFIQANMNLTINIASATDALHQQTLKAFSNINHKEISSSLLDFNKGNVKARTRMAAQYEVAGLLGGLVLGTDHSSENITGFFTKWGDGACDLAPLFGLNKRQVKQIARYLGASERLVSKAPTADLECLSPSKTDESALGISYEEIDDFLEGKELSALTNSKLIDVFNRTQHKRRSIPTIYD